jgi:sodium pump decarboxylase gamma subunit
MEQNILSAVMLLLVGMAVTFSCLLFLSAMIWSFKWVDERINSRRIRRYAQKVEAKPEGEEINDEVAAVIAAALTAALRRPIVIRHVRFLESGRAGQWAVAGRLNVMASHAISRRKTSQ